MNDNYRVAEEGEVRSLQPHNSMRGHFAWYLYDFIKDDPNIVLICVDLGYGMMDAIRDDFPDQVIITPASEQSAMGVAVGLALSGKIPLIYSITPFILWRCSETIRLYVNAENIPVKIVGSGRDMDYAHDGFSHDATDASELLKIFSNIVEYWPISKESLERDMKEMIYNKKPSFISLKRNW